MKKATLMTIVGGLLPLASGPMAHAVNYNYSHGHDSHHGYHNYNYPHYYNNYYPYYYYPYSYYPSYNYCYYGGYGCSYYMETTDSNFRTDIVGTRDNNQEQLYLQGARDAESYLKNGGEPSATLREAINVERGIAQKSGMEEAKRFDDKTFAQIVLGRVDQLTHSATADEETGGDDQGY